MKRTWTTSAAVLLGFFMVVDTADGGRVRGHFRKDGTYVAPYYRGSSGTGTSSSSGTGIPCGNSYISAGETCHIGTPAATPAPRTFASCADARAAGFSDMVVGAPGYSDALDRDHDGIACESGGGDTGTTLNSTSAPKPSVAPLPKAGAVVRTTTGVNLRSAPSAVASKVAVLAKGTALTLQSCSGTWCKVTVAGKTGYVIAASLTSSGTAMTPAPTAGTPLASSAAPKMAGTSCPHFDLGTTGITVDIPARFPNPATQKTVAHLKCDGFSFDYTGDELQINKKISISGPSWKQAWDYVNKGSLSLSLDVDALGRLVINDGMASFTSEQPAGTNKNAVLGLSVAGGALKPILFDGKVTPQKMGTGNNHFLLKSSFPYGDYLYIDIDTIKNTVVLTPNPDAL